MENSTCIICFEPNDLIKNNICENNCNFYYHEKCYTEWQQRERHPLCLVCKESVPNLVTGEFSLINPLNRHLERHERNYMIVENSRYRNNQENREISKRIVLIFTILLCFLSLVVILLVLYSI